MATKTFLIDSIPQEDKPEVEIGYGENAAVTVGRVIRGWLRKGRQDIVDEYMERKNGCDYDGLLTLSEQYTQEK